MRRSAFRLQLREEIESLERLDPLTRGRLFHEVQAELVRALEARDALPVTRARLVETWVVLDATADQVGDCAGLEGRILGATDAEVTAAGTVVTAALAHPLLARARVAVGAGACRRETPVTMQAEDGTLVEGVVDLAFRDDGTWVVVDFKTDREVEREHRLEHRKRWYACSVVCSWRGRYFHRDHGCK